VTDYFFDSSALVKRYVNETGSSWVIATTAAEAGHRIFISQITQPEVVSALARQKREGNLSPRTAHAARIYLDRHAVRSYDVLPLSDKIIQRAEDLLEIHPLRAADSLQLASAIAINDRLIKAGLTALIFVSSDIRLLNIAQAEGLPIHLPV
jgi:hypothetical protein